MELNKLWQKIHEAQENDEDEIDVKTEEGDVVKIQLHKTGWYSDYY